MKDLNKHIEQKLTRYCDTLNAYSHYPSAAHTYNMLTLILKEMWEEMRALGLFCNYDKFPSDAVYLTHSREVGVVTFKWSTVPFWREDGEKWIVRTRLRRMYEQDK